MNRPLFGHVWRSQRRSCSIVVRRAAVVERCSCRSSTPRSGRRSSSILARGSVAIRQELDEVRRRRPVQPRRRDRARLHPPDRRSAWSSSSRSASRRRRSPASASGGRWRCSSRGRCRAPARRHAGVRRAVRRPRGRGAVVGTLVGAAVGGRPRRAGVGRLPLLWLNGVLLFGAIGAIARRVGLVRPADAGARGHPGVRDRVVLPRDPRLALAGRPGAPAVLALPLPRRRRRSSPGSGRDATSPCWPRSSSRRCRRPP